MAIFTGQQGYIPRMDMRAATLPGQLIGEGLSNIGKAIERHSLEEKRKEEMEAQRQEREDILTEITGDREKGKKLSKVKDMGTAIDAYKMGVQRETDLRNLEQYEAFNAPRQPKQPTFDLSPYEGVPMQVQTPGGIEGDILNVALGGQAPAPQQYGQITPEVVDKFDPRTAVSREDYLARAKSEGVDKNPLVQEESKTYHTEKYLKDLVRTEQEITKEQERIQKDEKLQTDIKSINDELDVWNETGLLGQMDSKTLTAGLLEIADDNKLATDMVSGLLAAGAIDKTLTEKDKQELKSAKLANKMKEMQIEDDIASNDFTGWDGKVRGGDSVKMKLRESQFRFRKASQVLDTMIYIAENKNRFLTGLTEDSAEAKTITESLASALRGSMRLDIVGPGALTEKELAVLEKLIPSPTDFFSRLKPKLSQLRALKSTLRGSIETQMEVYGLSGNKNNKWLSAPINATDFRDRRITESIMGINPNSNVSRISQDGVFKSKGNVHMKRVQRSN